MKVVINGRFLTQRVTGVQRYAHEIVAELDRISNLNEFILAVPPDADSIPNYQNIKVVRVGKLHDQLWEQISFPLFVQKQKAASLNLCNVAPLVNPGIVCIFDMKVKAHPEFFSKTFTLWYRVQFWNSINRARMILTDSNSAKSQILHYYPKITPERISVIPAAWQHYERIGFSENALDQYGLTKDDYFFAMSSFEPNKNFKWIAEVAKHNPKENFAIAGSINDKIFAEGLGFEVPENMKLLGYTSDEEVKTLMKECKAFLFPSFYEGFGIPPLEALSAGAKRLIVSDIDVMHEIFGESVEYINPQNYEYDFKKQISVNNADYQTVLDKYSWKSSAENLYRLLQETMK